MSNDNILKAPKISINIPNTFSVRVTTKASSNKVKIDSVENGCIKLARVYVTSAPEDGKANAMVIKLLATFFDIPKSSICITHGLRNRNKIITIRS
ncbi:MAG: DUF167 domain-containing protein [Proteobacteria bacterium]|nr:DUF167 domain-containing protein [Pseudomonadota bacterium]